MKKTLLLLLSLSTPLWAELPVPSAPSTHTYTLSSDPGFLHRFEFEGGAMAAGSDQQGAQFARIETRYLDRDVNAFVGLIGVFTRFNEKLVLGEPPDETKSLLIANWGACLGMIRGRHLWAIDLMGASLGERLAFGPAIVGEHSLGKSFTLFHRTAGDFFTNDTILDSDQGVTWHISKTLGLTVGYRIFTSDHMNRNGPRVGLLLRFESPKIPFLFPSLG